MDGIEATSHLAGPDVARPLPIVVITTFDLDEYVYEALRAGARGFLLKDAGPALLTQAIRAAADDAARILILTTFDLDEYVYEALRVGASGFVLKDEPPEQLIAAIRTIAAGEALLSPSITKRVIKQFARAPRAAAPKEFDELTAREQEVFRLIANGLSNAEIGQELFISDTTVKTHITHILQKLGLRDRVQAVVLAYQTGLVEADGQSQDEPTG